MSEKITMLQSEMLEKIGELEKIKSNLDDLKIIMGQSEGGRGTCKDAIIEIDETMGLILKNGKILISGTITMLNGIIDTFVTQDEALAKKYN